METKYCSHILSINNEKKDVTKGNLFLGGTGTFAKPIMQNFNIKAVLTIIDEKFYKTRAIDENIKKY
jgi:hypothetical protein